VGCDAKFARCSLSGIGALLLQESKKEPFDSWKMTDCFVRGMGNPRIKFTLRFEGERFELNRTVILDGRSTELAIYTSNGAIIHNSRFQDNQEVTFRFSSNQVVLKNTQLVRSSL